MTLTDTRPAPRGSAYPATVDDLLPQARALAGRLGELPSRNRLKRELRIGASKAAALLDALTTGTHPTSPPRAATPAPAAVEVAPVDVHEDTPTVTVPPVPPVPPGDGTGPAAPAAAAPSSPAGPVVRVRSWPVLLLALPAFVAIWSGWVGLGELAGFGVVHPLPGIWDTLAVNTAITLPIGMEVYAAYALRAWLTPGAPVRARRFARWSTVAALVLGAAGQVAYHLMSAAGMTTAPWQITTVVACLPVAVLGMGAALAHLLHETTDLTGSETGEARP